MIPSVLEDLTEEEAYLFALLMDPSGIDQVEFSVTDNKDSDDGCFRCWPFQWAWWRCTDAAQIDRSGRSIGKSMSIEARAYAFPFVHGGDEMVITAPEGVHLDAITDRIETMLEGNRLTRELLKTGRGGIKHRPFHVNFSNGARIMGRIPQHNGKGVKGCLQLQAPALTRNRGYVKAGDLVVGDELLNDQGKWTKIRKLIYDTNDCYRVEGAGSYPVEVSCDHRFLGASNLGTAKTKRDFSAGLYYNDVEFLLEDQFYWASPTEFPYVDPVYPEFNNYNKQYDVESEDFWWLVGLYAADGYLRESTVGQGVTCVNWVSHPDNKGRKKLIKALENLGCRYRITKRSHSSADQIEWASAPVASWLEEHFGRTAITKHLPTFMLSLPKSFKEAFLDGYLMGDGHYNEKKNRWECGSASKELMMMIQLIAQSIGLKVGATYVQPKVTHINGTKLKKKPEISWRLHISLSGHSYELDGYLLGKVKKVTPIGEQPIVNILVEEGQSYLGGTIMNHNIHPIWLELDEAQDYPDAGWTELLETLKNGEDGAVWRAHGVTRGIPDRFQKYTAPDSGWTVHKFTAVHRPNWTEQERKQKIKKYGGSEDNVDFRRNVYGFHGDASNPIFVLSRLMACVDKKNGEDGRPASKFNEDYYRLMLDGEQLAEVQDPLDFINLSSRKGTFWIGADIGYTTDPTEILVFEEDNPGPGSKLSLIARVQLRRVNAINQAQIVLHLLEVFNPIRFSMDKMQPVSEPVLTPNGWTPIGQIQVGDLVVGSDGSPIEVTGVFPQVDKRVETIVFSDGSSTRCGPEHLWTASVKKNGLHYPDGRTLFTTEQLQQLKDQGWSVSIPLVSPVDLPAAELPVDPYVLGCLLGDGNLREHSIRFSSIDEQIISRMSSLLPDGHEFRHIDGCDYYLSGTGSSRGDDGRFIDTNKVLKQLKLLGLAGKKSFEKFIPEIYFTGSIDQRLQLLRGLMDTDGFADEQQVGFGTSSEALIDDLRRLVWSLGGTATKRSRIPVEGYRRQYKSSIVMPVDLNPFHLDRKAIHGNRRSPVRYLREIRCSDPEESVCIRVNSEDHLYVTKDYILTHNTGNGLPLLQVIQGWAVDNPKLNKRLEMIEGFNFSGKVLFELDESIEVDLHRQNLIDEAGIEKKVLECSTDVLRDLVDQRRLVLPYDEEIILEFSGENYALDKSTMDMYGRSKRVSKGSFHTLDAARMAALGWQQFYFKKDLERKLRRPTGATGVIFL